MKKQSKNILSFIIVFIVLLLAIFFLAKPLVLDYNLFKEQQLAIEKESLKNKDAFDVDLEKDKSHVDINQDSLKLLALLYIPKLQLNLPVYEGTSEAVLTKGIGHLENTAALDQGKGNRPAITTHSGLSIGQLFTRLGELENKDKFYLKMPDDKILAYEVVKKEKVLPTAADKLQPVEGKDLLTLITCTSGTYEKENGEEEYLYNGFRYLITGERAENDIKLQAFEPQTTKDFMESHKLYISIIFVLSVFALGFMLYNVYKFVNRLLKT